MARMVAVGVAGVLLVAGGLLAVYLPGSPFHQSDSLSFHFTGGTAVYKPSTGQTNVTLTLVNTGTVLIRLGGEQGVAPPPPYQYVEGSFHAYFFDRNGTQVFGGGGNPPVTTMGGRIVATYLMTGAKAGDVFVVNTTVTANGMSATQSITLTVTACQTGGAGCQTATTSTTTTSSTTTTTTSTSSTTDTSSTSTTSSVTTSSTVSSTTTTTSSTSSTSTTQSTTTTRTTTTTSTKSTTTSSSASPYSWYFLSASAVYNPGNGQTNITLVLVDNGTQPLMPSVMKNKTPPGTLLVSGSWTASYYTASGAYICTAPVNCKSSILPEVENGGHVVVTMLVTGATVGEALSMTYTFGSGSWAVTNTIDFTVVSG